MRILIKSAESVRVKMIPGKEGRPARELMEQQAALDSNGGFPLPFWLKIENGKPYAPGLYDFDPTSFRNTPFGGIELDKYDIRLLPVQMDSAKK